MTLVSQSIDPQVGQSMVRVIVFRPTLGLIRGPVQWYIGLHGRGSPVIVITLCFGIPVCWRHIINKKY